MTHDILMGVALGLGAAAITVDIIQAIRHHRRKQ